MAPGNDSARLRTPLSVCDEGRDYPHSPVAKRVPLRGLTGGRLRGQGHG